MLAAIGSDGGGRAVDRVTASVRMTTGGRGAGLPREWSGTGGRGAGLPREWSGEGRAQAFGIVRGVNVPYVDIGTIDPFGGFV